VKPICEKVTDLAEKSAAQLNDEVMKAAMAAIGGESAKSGGQAGCETDKAEDGITELISVIEDMGQLMGRKQQGPDNAGNSAGEEMGTENVKLQRLC
jgi:hypothetical protein